eukprot:CAMPEP_0116991686 /NCGR_PEP_ID=MMETSP0467-20121206/66301_1 /TAXON_ID=283647 /ORGANISM="Mesodinium pulex, Strain SPMC105" /LENGTH=43 /DNA_ID= /DNA_START= /DNA_END= /DNA_ORIENTATION=
MAVINKRLAEKRAKAEESQETIEQQQKRGIEKAMKDDIEFKKA